jgi:transcriptional regulator with XRE-family HTH domain
MESKFCDKLIQLRRERGMSQEQLADRLEVSRQAVSKWEGDQSMPSLDKILQIADMFGVSVDYLVRNSTVEGTSSFNEENSQAGTTFTNENSQSVIDQLNELTQMVRRKNSEVYEYKSKRTVFGIPLVHVKVSRYGKPALAKGIIAIGNISVGLISLGAISAGLLSFGALSAGLILALGAISLGGISFGGVSIGLFACGGVAIGMYSFGGVALASKVACGGVASATIALGDVVNGDHTLDIAVATKDQIKQVILENDPNIPRVILDLFLMVAKR